MTSASGLCRVLTWIHFCLFPISVHPRQERCTHGNEVWGYSSSYFRVATGLLIFSYSFFSLSNTAQQRLSDRLIRMVCLLCACVCPGLGCRSLCIIILCWMKCAIWTFASPLNKMPQTINGRIKHTYCRRNTNTYCQPAPTQEGYSVIEIKHGVQRHKQRGRADPDKDTVGQLYSDRMVWFECKSGFECGLKQSKINFLPYKKIWSD